MGGVEKGWLDFATRFIALEVDLATTWERHSTACTSAHCGVEPCGLGAVLSERGESKALSPGPSATRAESLDQLQELANVHVLPSCSSTPHAHRVVYHVDFHGATSHMKIHVVNHGRKTTW